MISQKQAKQLRWLAQVETKGQPNVSYINRRHREVSTTVVLSPNCTRGVYKALKRAS